MRSSLKRGLLAVALALVVAIGFANLLGNHRVDTANEASSSSTSECIAQPGPVKTIRQPGLITSRLSGGLTFTVNRVVKGPITGFPG